MCQMCRGQNVSSGGGGVAVKSSGAKADGSITTMTGRIWWERSKGRGSAPSKCYRQVVLTTTQRTYDTHIPRLWECVCAFLQQQL